MSDESRRPGSALVQLQWLCVFEAAILGLVIVLLRDKLLPERFLADGFLIGEIAGGRAEADSSFMNSAAVYRVLGLADRPLLAFMLGYALGIASIVAVWWRLRGSGAMSWGVTALMCVAILLCAVYLGYYSKDVLLVPVALAAVLLPARRSSTLALVALMLGYAVLFRQYWFLVAGVFVVLVLVQKVSSPRWFLLWGLLASMASSVALIVVTGGAADSFRIAVNDGRMDEVVGTRIDQFVSGDGAAVGVVNNALTYLALLVPAPVALRGGLYYLLIAVVVGLVWIQFGRALWRMGSWRSDPIVARCAALVVAFVAVQSLFEPDFGSALRHLTPLLPLVALVALHVNARAGVDVDGPPYLAGKPGDSARSGRILAATHG